MGFLPKKMTMVRLVEIFMYSDDAYLGIDGFVFHGSIAVVSMFNMLKSYAFIYNLSIMVSRVLLRTKPWA